jgi:hypothetical protein
MGTGHDLRRLVLVHLDELGATENNVTSFMLQVLIVLILEAQFAILKQLERKKSFAYDSEASAYTALIKRIEDNNVEKIDLIQLSGQIAQPFLMSVLNSKYNVKVRMLLLHDDISIKFDQDNSENFPEHYEHTARVSNTLEQLKLVANANKKPMPRYYRSYPSVCSVLIDDKTICMAWYRTFFDGKSVLRVRSHDGPAIITDREESEPLVKFTQMHFKKLWDYSEADRISRRRTTAEI